MDGVEWRCQSISGTSILLGKGKSKWICPDRDWLRTSPVRFSRHGRLFAGRTKNGLQVWDDYARTRSELLKRLGNAATSGDTPAKFLLQRLQ